MWTFDFFNENSIIDSWLSEKLIARDFDPCVNESSVLFSREIVTKWNPFQKAQPLTSIGNCRYHQNTKLRKKSTNYSNTSKLDLEKVYSCLFEYFWSTSRTNLTTAKHLYFCCESQNLSLCRIPFLKHEKTSEPIIFSILI